MAAQYSSSSVPAGTYLVTPTSPAYYTLIKMLMSNPSWDRSRCMHRHQ
ncbi:hypothetical protein V6Z11_D01G217300 [Gossypium hirsutum]